MFSYKLNPDFRTMPQEADSQDSQDTVKQNPMGKLATLFSCY